MADKPDRQTKEDLEKMRRVKLRELAVIYGKSNSECSNAQSQDLIDFILAAQDGKKVVKKGKDAEPARGKGKAAEPEEEEEEAPEEEEEEAPRGKGKGKAAEPEEEEEAPRGRRGRREAPAEEEEEAPRGRRTTREERTETVEEPEGGASDEKLDALGKTMDEMGEQVAELRKSNFVIMGMLREVCADFMKKSEVDTMIEELEADFEKGNE